METIKHLLRILNFRHFLRLFSKNFNLLENNNKKETY